MSRSVTARGQRSPCIFSSLLRCIACSRLALTSHPQCCSNPEARGADNVTCCWQVTALGLLACRGMVIEGLMKGCRDLLQEGRFSSVVFFNKYPKLRFCRRVTRHHALWRRLTPHRALRLHIFAATRTCRTLLVPIASASTKWLPAARQSLVE